MTHWASDVLFSSSGGGQPFSWSATNCVKPPHHGRCQGRRAKHAKNVPVAKVIVLQDCHPIQCKPCIPLPKQCAFLLPFLTPPAVPIVPIPPTPPVLLRPTITSATSPVTPLGLLTITGTNFTPGSVVTINGVVVPASGVTVINSTTIQVIVPVNATSGNVVVTTPAGPSNGFPIVALPTPPAACVLKTANGFAILAGSAITNTGPTTIKGDVGLFPGTSITGFGSVTLTGTIHATDAVAQQAQADLTTAYNFLSSQPCTTTLPGAPAELGGLILTAGVYCVGSSAQITGPLTLTGNGVFIFKIPSALTTGAGSSVVLTGVDPCNVYFLVGSSATLGVGTQFQGNILAQQSITATTSATVNGRLLASAGAVTLDTNTITAPTCACTP